MIGSGASIARLLVCSWPAGEKVAFLRSDGMEVRDFLQGGGFWQKVRLHFWVGEVRLAGGERGQWPWREQWPTAAARLLLPQSCTALDSSPP